MRGQLLALCSVLLASHPAACAAEKLLAISGPEAVNKAVLSKAEVDSHKADAAGAAATNASFAVSESGAMLRFQKDRRENRSRSTL